VENSRRSSALACGQVLTAISPSLLRNFTETESIDLAM
jgi:hypothetical protein